jgi:hypothetical protein
MSMSVFALKTGATAKEQEKQTHPKHDHRRSSTREPRLRLSQEAQYERERRRRLLRRKVRTRTHEDVGEEEAAEVDVADCVEG